MTRRTETSPYVALLAIAAAMLVGIALTGCEATATVGDPSDASSASTAGDAIAWVGKDPGGITSAVLVDQETGVEYLLVKYVGVERGGVSVTPLLNADGTPRRMED